MGVLLGVIRYAGQERETLVRLPELGLAERCDVRLRDEPKPVTRDQVTFNFTRTANSEGQKAQEIVKHCAGFLSAKPAQGAVRALRHRKDRAWFRYEWGGVNVGGFSVLFLFEPRGQKWALGRLREDGISTTAFSVAVEKALRKRHSLFGDTLVQRRRMGEGPKEGSPRLY